VARDRRLAAKPGEVAISLLGRPAPELQRAEVDGGQLIGAGLQKTIGASGSTTVEDGGVAVSLVLPLSTGLVLRADPAERQEAG